MPSPIATAAYLTAAFICASFPSPAVSFVTSNQPFVRKIPVIEQIPELAKIGVLKQRSLRSSLAEIESKADIDPSALRLRNGYLSVGSKKLNLYGIIFLIQSCLVAGPIWLVMLAVWAFLSKVLGEKFDKNAWGVHVSCKFWAFWSLVFSANWPTIEGLENIPGEDEAVLIVSNHSSYMDIPYVGCVPMFYKFFAKAELKKTPILGWSLELGNHCLVDRDDRRSQMESFRLALSYLSDGISIVTFPEGTRSKDGRLTKFKSGPFKLSHKTKCRVLPISIVGAPEVHPYWALMPIQSGPARMIIHPLISVDGMTEEEIEEAAFNAIKNGLPPQQQPAEKEGEKVAAA